MRACVFEYHQKSPFLVCNNSYIKIHEIERKRERERGKEISALTFHDCG